MMKRAADHLLPALSPFAVNLTMPIRLVESNEISKKLFMRSEYSTASLGGGIGLRAESQAACDDCHLGWLKPLRLPL
jgi:hypothetical protein